MRSIKLYNFLKSLGDPQGAHSIIIASCKPGRKPGRRLASWSKADRKPTANLLQTWWFLPPRVWHDLRNSTSLLQYGGHRRHSTVVLRSLSEVYRFRDSVSSQEETETLHIMG